VETVAVVIGVLVVAVALIGFLRSLWRPLRERGSGRGDSDVANAGGIERFQRQHLAMFPFSARSPPSPPSAIEAAPYFASKMASIQT
jgi:hypothetical protein